MFLFLRRIRHCAGFGVQSPTDYAFVREVIYERLPYYAYEELAATFPDVEKRVMWMARLMLRVANYAQAERIVYCDESVPDIYKMALQRGCRKTDITQCNAMEDIRKLCQDDGVWFVIPNIYKENNALWQCLKSQENVVSFDLYHLAIAFVDMKRYRETHIINPY